MILSNEKELLFELSQGSERAFEKLYKFYSPRVFGKMIKLLKSEPVASELLQDVFLRIWELRQNIDPEKCFKSYLFRIAINKVYDYFRKSARDRKLQFELMKTISEEDVIIEENIINTESINLLHQAISSLPPQRQQIFRLCKIEGKSYKEVSSKLSISTSTISDHIVKANNCIRNYFYVFSPAF
jgi:RNA polymerase sigma-70 factor (family 1)